MDLFTLMLVVHWVAPRALFTADPASILMVLFRSRRPLTPSEISALLAQDGEQ